MAALTASELRSRPGVGPSTVAEVVALLASHGKQLRPEAPKPSPAADAAPYREAWDAAWKAHRRGPYAWDFHRDNRGLLKIAAVAKTPERARRAFDAFLRAHAVGRGVFPYDEAPTIAKFALKPATHVVAADQADETPPQQRIADEWAALRAGHTPPARDVIDAEPAPDAEELTPIQRMFPGVFDHLTNKEKNR